MRYLLSLLIILGPIGTVWSQERLSATLGEVLLRRLQPGTTYHLMTDLNLPLRITYEGQRSVQLLLQPVLPEPSEMKKGYESIPDISWVQVSPSAFELHSSSIVKSEISIQIPDDEALLGKSFMFYVWTQSIPQEAGFGVGMGTKSRILFTIADEKQEKTNSELKAYMDFLLDPQSVSVRGVQPGKKFRLKRALKKKIYIRNNGKETKVFHLERAMGDEVGIKLSQGSNWGPEGSVLQVSPEKLKIKGGRSKAFDVSLLVPDSPDSYGQKYQYLLRVSPQPVGVKSSIVFRMNVETVESAP